MSVVSATLPVVQDPNNPGLVRQATPVCNPDGSSLAGATANNPIFTSASRQTTPVKGAIGNGQTVYAANQCIGTIVAIPTGLPGGTLLASGGTVRIKARQADWTTQNVLFVEVFDAAPSGTFTDGLTPAATTADVDKAILLQSVSISSSTGAVAIGTMTLPRIAVDAGGFIYVLCVASGAEVFTGTNVLRYEFSAPY